MTDDSTDPDDVDARSVGELLLDADLTSRAALWNPAADLATARARTWGEVVEAAAQLWSAIPDRAGDPSMRRIAQLTAALHRTQRRTQWPGAGPTDPHLESIATSLTRAAQLVAGRRHTTAALSPAAHLDSEAARTRLMHVLYASAHSTTVCLDRYAETLRQRLSQHQALRAGESPRRAQDTRERVAAVERLAGSYLLSRWPAALTGEHRDPIEPDRLQQALARWDVQAHRTLAGTPTAINLTWIVRVQRDITLATAIIGSAAGARGVLDPQHTQRLGSALAALEQAWATVGAALEPLQGRHRRPDSTLLLAAGEARAALRDITHEGAGLTTHAVMASRVDLAAAAASLGDSLTAGVDLAHVLRDAVQDPQLTVAARAAHTMATSGGDEPPLAGWVHAGDLHHNREITLPVPARQILTEHVSGVIAAALAAESAGAAFRPAQAPSERTLVEQTQLGRQHEDRAPPALASPPDPPGWGGER
ncbi:MAG: hypothetical protein ACOYBY_10990 [Dermatophilaceae bacterium]